MQSVCISSSSSRSSQLQEQQQQQQQADKTVDALKDTVVKGDEERYDKARKTKDNLVK